MSKQKAECEWDWMDEWRGRWKWTGKWRDEQRQCVNAERQAEG